MTTNQNGKINTVAILGAGPAASTLATLLVSAGLKVAMLHRPRTAPLLVGESLVPAIVLMLRELGVSEQRPDPARAAHGDERAEGHRDFPASLGARSLYPAPRSTSLS